MRRLVFLLLFLAAPAHAVEYEVFVAIQDQDELDELRLNQEIDDETYQALTELLDVGVDLEDADVDTIYSLPNLTREEADRIVEYRDKAGGLPDPAALVFAGILSDEKLLALAPFLRVSERRVGQIPVTVRGSLQTWYVPGDDRVPATQLAARARIGRELTLGLMGFNTERRLGGVVYDPVRDALSAEAPAFGFDAPKFFAQWDNGPVRAIAGTYTIGFGQRLTFDTTGLETPMV